jgi:hypothetical protein
MLTWQYSFWCLLLKLALVNCDKPIDGNDVPRNFRRSSSCWGKSSIFILVWVEFPVPSSQRSVRFRISISDSKKFQRTGNRPQWKMKILLLWIVRTDSPYISIFLRFSLGYFPTASRTYADNVHRKVPESPQNTVFCNRRSGVCLPFYDIFNCQFGVFNRYTASLYRISTVITLQI